MSERIPIQSKKKIFPVKVTVTSNEIPMKVDVNDKAAVMMLPSWSMILRMD
ncbi:15754_t:CDS:2 [Acaulospora morrowiae]|uniref:15754_t:CDS:1 n=1 Tax=Acaulospora morrowiae TaxID=94023 RepID=A0A9N9BIT2_9GLOM|nr:15754_t:CDS:2 [Acaulospora morrowiae]